MHAQILLMYEQYIEKLQSPVHCNRPERDIWTEANQDTIEYGSLECDPPKWTRVINNHVRTYTVCNYSMHSSLYATLLQQTVTAIRSTPAAMHGQFT